MKSPELSEFFSLLGEAKKEKEEEFDNLLKEANINLDVLVKTVSSGIEKAKVEVKEQKEKGEKFIEQLDVVLDNVSKPEEVVVGVPEDFDIESLEEDDDYEELKKEIGSKKKPKKPAVEEIKEEDSITKALKFIEDTTVKEEVNNSDVDVQSEIRKLKNILNRVLAQGPGSGEVNLLKLDDVDEDSAKVDGKVLQYQASSGKFIGGSASGIGTADNVNTSGIITAAQFSGYSHLVAPHASTTTIIVKVATKIDGEHRYYGQGSSLGYNLNDVQSPFLTLTPGRTYRFDQSDSSNSGHPLRFYYDAGKTDAYTTDVTTSGSPGSSGAYTEIEITDTTPTVLHYQCSAHGYMGNAVQVNSNVVDSPSGGTVRGSFSAEDNIKLRSQDGTPARIDLYCESNNAHYLRLQAPPHSQFSGNPTVILPNSAGTLLLNDGSGASLTNLNASNISSGTIGAARIPTLNQNTTGTSAGLTGNPSITVTNLTANGNVSIAGTLTYEDVTNVDSVGLITARSGIKVGSGITLSPDGDGFFTGVTTATTFVGDLTGTASNATQLNSQAASFYLDYNNFSNTPTIPTNNNQLTNGAGFITTSFTNTNQLTNGAGFITASDDITGNAATATILANARTIAGTSFNGSANIDIDFDNLTNKPTIPTNNNQLTNGAGFITGSALNASNLNSGTIPDARFPSALPAIDGSALTGVASTDNIRTNTNATFLQNVNVSGTTTATTFIGDLTGDVTGTASNATLAVSAQGLTGSPNVTVTNVNAVDAIISGNLSVAGTITSLDQNDILATGIITASSGVDLGDPGIITLSSDTLTTTSTSADTISSVSATVNRSATFQVQVTRGTEYHVTTINVVHDGTNAFLSEFGTIRTGSILATFDADISGGNLRLRATPTTTASTVFKLSKTVIKV